MEAEVPTVEAKPKRHLCDATDSSSVVHNVQAGTASGSQVVVIDISKEDPTCATLGCARGCR